VIFPLGKHCRVVAGKGAIVFFASQKAPILVEASGIEPESVSSLPSALHA